MLNKEDILALAWEHSEGSGKRYIFTEESLFEFLKELKKEPPPAQAEQQLAADLYEIGGKLLEIAHTKTKAVSTTLMAPRRDYTLKDARYSTSNG